ncbi:uncharacterized protein LOC143548420 [Bidens hawaiensis]|uniref:uncharacterized protein LOC143548420 n=1 Tax=Bidens hawaiensis TaxID=980011 RepID=UPI0040496C29
MKGLRISRAKTEYLRCDFSGVIDDEEVQINIEGQVVPQVTKFKYLGSFVQSDGEIDSDVAHRVQVGWCRWRAATGVLCDKRFPAKLKGRFYSVAVETSHVIWNRLLGHQEDAFTKVGGSRDENAKMDVWEHKVGPNKK